MPQTLYTARVHVTGGRDGTARSSDGRLDIKLSLPGGPGTGTNPEQLLAAGWSACFEGAMAIAAKSMQIALPAETAIDAEIDLARGEDGFFLRARLTVHLPGLDRETANAVIDAAHSTCPYSKALGDKLDAAFTLA